MKKNTVACWCSVLLLSATAPALAQSPAAAAPAGGYWNIETNLTTRDYTIVRFFDQQDRLVYEERLDQLCLNLGPRSRLCRRTVAQLNQTLQQLLDNPQLAARSPYLLTRQFATNRRVQRVYAVR